MSLKIKSLLFTVALIIIAGGVFFVTNQFTSDAPAPSTSVRSVSDSPSSPLPPIARPEPHNPLGSLERAEKTLDEALVEAKTEASGLLDKGYGGDAEEGLEPHELENAPPSTHIPDLLPPPELGGTVATVEKEGKVVRLTVEDSHPTNSRPPSILGTRSISDGAVIASSQDPNIPFSLIQHIARDVVNGYWPQGSHVLATSSGSITTNLALLNTRYGPAVAERYNASASSKGIETSGQSRQGLLNYVLMPSMVEGLYELYAERFIRLINHEAKNRLSLRQGVGQHLSNTEIAEMYGLYARSLRSNAGCIRAFMNSSQVRQNAEKFILAEQEATDAHMAYQEETLKAEGAGRAPSHSLEQQYRIKVVQRENARQNLAASFRRFTDTRNVDTNDLVFLAKWLNRRSTAHKEGVLALATTLETLAARMEREQHSFLTQQR